MKIAVIGVGNPFRGDDGAGRAVARLVAERAPEAVEVVESAGGAADLIECWEGFDAAIVVDTLASSLKPGHLLRLDASREPLPARLAGSSTHDLGVAEAIELGRVLGRLPRTLIVLAVEGREFGRGAMMSEPVREALEGVAEAVLAEVRRLREPVPA